MTTRTPAPYRGEYDDRTIGLRLRRVRLDRRMTLQVVADLSGTSRATLSKIENGQVALDSHKLLFALADTLHIAPCDLMSLPIPAPANGNTDSSIGAVRHALMAVTDGHPGGEVQPVEQLRHRYQEIVNKNRQEHGDFKDCGAVLPGLIADLHTTLDQRREVAELLPLAVVLHSGPVGSFLGIAGASTDLRWQDVMIARMLAEQLENPILLTFVANRATNIICDNGTFDLARNKLDATTVNTNTSDGLQVGGMLALNRSVVAMGQGCPAETAAALEYAAELATRITGDPFTTGLGHVIGFSPVAVDLWRMFTALESGDPDEVIRIAQTMNPQENPFVSFQAACWSNYGRALTKVRRRDDAARALLRAEKLHPVRALRGIFTREALVELVAHPPTDAGLRTEIRGMAYRARLPL